MDSPTYYWSCRCIYIRIYSRSGDILTHPWDDLTEEELRGMVEWCEKYFRPENILQRVNFNGTITTWKWEKGDWRATIRLEMDGSVHHIDVDLMDDDSMFFHGFGPPSYWIPLPLAHQWEALPEWAGCVLGNRIITFPKSITIAEHNNPHYLRYLAFRKVIEDEL